MSTCERLFPAEKIVAFFNAEQKQVVIEADVIANPVADDVHICRNPIAIPASREFIIAGTTKSGVHPDLVAVRRVSFSFSSDLTPKSVFVYSDVNGVPTQQEVLLTL